MWRSGPFTVLLLVLVRSTPKPTFVLAESGDNIHLFRSEIAAVLEHCGSEGGSSRKEANLEFESRANTRKTRGSYDREDENDDDAGSKEWTDPKDDKHKTDSVYHHDRRHQGNGQKRNNTSRNGIRLNDTDDEGDYRSIKDLNFSTDLYDPYLTRGIKSTTVGKRFKRLDYARNDDGECLSQCVFSNLKIVDDKGIPKESLFVKFLQDNVTSQQTRTLIEKLIHDCFRELISESVENECTYSNALDRCMNLQLKKRKTMADEDSLLGISVIK